MLTSSSDGGPGTIPGTRHVATAFRIDPASGALTPHGGTVWLFPTPRCTYGIDLVALLEVIHELHLLLWHERRDSGEVDDYQLLALGMAVGTLGRLGQLPVFHPPSAAP